MKTYNIIGLVFFALFGIICLIAGFSNPVHFLFACGCFAVCWAALNEKVDEDGSIKDKIINKLNK